MKKLQVLMSTYNGEKYLEEQLQSILDQNYPEVYLLIRDDGSTDKTVNILQKYAAEYERITFYQGSNLGACNSYFDLIQNADSRMDFYALSDQDDVWQKDKISSAINKMKDFNNIPLLYCGATTLVDENLELMISTIKRHNIKPGFGNSLVENINTGCTSVFNKDLMILIKNNIPLFTVMHDWWLYLCACVFGKVIYDKNSYILYRQHQGNVIGARSNYYDEFKKRIKNYNRNYGQLTRQAKEFNRIYSLTKDEANLINWVIKSKDNFTYRFAIIFSNKIYRQRKLDNFIFKIIFLFGRI